MGLSGDPAAARPRRGRSGPSSRLGAELDPQHPAGTRGPAKPKHRSSPSSPTGSGPLENTHPRAEKAPAAPASLPFVPRSPRPSRRSFRARTFHTLRDFSAGRGRLSSDEQPLQRGCGEAECSQGFFFFPPQAPQFFSEVFQFGSCPSRAPIRHGEEGGEGRAALRAPVRGSRPGGRNCAGSAAGIHPGDTARQMSANQGPEPWK
ncbi:uncharacterized protein LOC131917703 [Peromyscus eremicus]|uniref:uncharacterized protein LOC131917703 n=1 Tax=Peromyscus eremicus TaxID=42410 RepID=UPI0027DD18A9|nr:uncharacterized protein LOC131917703 [Peromyscus eremicus]